VASAPREGHTLNAERDGQWPHVQTNFPDLNIPNIQNGAQHKAYSHSP